MREGDTNKPVASLVFPTNWRGFPDQTCWLLRRRKARVLEEKPFFLLLF